MTTEIDDLRERVAYLEGLLHSSRTHLPDGSYLTEQQGRLLGVLLRMPVATEDALLYALYRGNDEPEYAASCMKVQMMRVRQRIRPFGGEIKSVYGTGYRLTNRKFLEDYDGRLAAE